MLTALLAVAAPAQSVWLDHVDVEYLPGRICIDNTIRFYIGATAGGSHDIGGMDNGFRIYSPDGAVWDTTIPDTIGTLGLAQFDFGYFVTSHNVTGSGADTVGFGGLNTQPEGMNRYFDTVAWVIEIGPVDPVYDRKTICLDSCWYPPTDRRWIWAYTGDDNDVYRYIPTWGGPYCFQIVEPCCQLVGDIDGNRTGPDIADLIYLVTFMFQDGPEPGCMEQADINGDDAPMPDISDLIYLVTYMFQNGPPLPTCPPSSCP